MDAEQTNATVTTESADERKDTASDPVDETTVSNDAAELEDTATGRSVSSASTAEQTDTDADSAFSAPLDERGDSTDSDSSNAENLPNLEQLTDKQLKVLRAIRDRPHATQAELAELFDVSRATISQRVNGIEGFEWQNRRASVDVMFDGVEPVADGNGLYEVSEALAASVDDLAERVATLERALNDASSNRSSAFGDPELTGTVIRACVDSDTVTEDEEIRIIAELIEAGRS